MGIEKANAQDALGATVIRGAGMEEKADAQGHYVVECFDADGKLKWRDTIDNLVTTEGKNYALDSFLAGASYTAVWYIGLIGSTSYTAVAVGDTAAQINGTNGWKESGSSVVPAYSQSTRPQASFSAAAAGSKSLSSAASFSITSSGTVKGCFLASASAKEAITGKLYSAGLFTGGDKVVSNGDTLNVSYTASL